MRAQIDAQIDVLLLVYMASLRAIEPINNFALGTRFFSDRRNELSARYSDFIQLSVTIGQV